MTPLATSYWAPSDQVLPVSLRLAEMAPLPPWLAMKTGESAAPVTLERMADIEPVFLSSLHLPPAVTRNWSVTLNVAWPKAAIASVG